MLSIRAFDRHEYTLSTEILEAQYYSISALFATVQMYAPYTCTVVKELYMQTYAFLIVDTNSLRGLRQDKVDTCTSLPSYMYRDA